MVTPFRSLASAFVVAFAFLFFGPSTSQVDAEHFRAPERHHRGDSRHGRYSHHGPSYRKHGRHHGSYGGYRPVRPYYGSYQPYYGGYPAYRIVRVFVPVPYPHWVYRRVYR